MAEGIIERALRTISDHVPQLVDPEEQPARFVRDLHKQWKEDGGKVAGKPRHSDRYLEDQLIAQNSRVRSLTPKLVGKTNISPNDAGILVRFILSNWPVSGSEDEEIQYEPLFPKAEVDLVAEYIEDQLKKSPASSSLQASEPGETGASDELPGEPTAELITRLFRESDAIITVAPEQVFVAAGPKTELIGFRNLMDRLRKVEVMDQKKRPLIWVLDLGGPSLEDLSTRQKYLNVQQLIVRFKALRHYSKDVLTREILDWLKTRVAIVILDTYGDWRDKVNLIKLPDFSTHHASLTTTTTDWMSSPNFRALYGPDLEEDRMRQRVFQVFYNASSDWNSDVEADLRYVGFASFKKSRDETVGRGLELPPLPARYAEAFRTVCAAAASALDIKMSIPGPLTGKESINQLEYLGYRVLNIEQFLDQY